MRILVNKLREKDCDVWKELEKTKNMSPILAPSHKPVWNGVQLKPGYQKLNISNFAFMCILYLTSTGRRFQTVWARSLKFWSKKSERSVDKIKLLSPWVTSHYGAAAISYWPFYLMLTVFQFEVLKVVISKWFQLGEGAWYHMKLRCFCFHLFPLSLMGLQLR